MNLAKRVGQSLKARSDIWTAASAIAAVVATFLAAWAAWETHRGAAETAKATRASVWLQLLTEYAQPEMLNSMKALREWRDSDRECFDSNFRSLLLSSETTPAQLETTRALDEYRRRVASFFNKLRVLAEGGVIDEKFVSATWSTGTYTYIRDVLMPLERAKSDALLQAGGISADDRAVSNKIESEMLEFYSRVASRSKQRYR
jgi:hypothetical protein